MFAKRPLTKILSGFHSMRRLGTDLAADTCQHASIAGLTLHVTMACRCASEMVLSRHSVMHLVCADLLHQALSKQAPGE